MKVKTSVTLSPELLAAIDKRCGARGSRSEFVEQAAWDAIRAEEREASRAEEIRIRDAHDLAIYLEFADEYRKNDLDSLELQSDDW